MTKGERLVLGNNSEISRNLVTFAKSELNGKKPAEDLLCCLFLERVARQVYVKVSYIDGRLLSCNKYKNEDLRKVSGYSQAYDSLRSEKITITHLNVYFHPKTFEVRYAVVNGYMGTYCFDKGLTLSINKDRIDSLTDSELKFIRDNFVWHGNKWVLKEGFSGDVLSVEESLVLMGFNCTKRAPEGTLGHSHLLRRKEIKAILALEKHIMVDKLLCLNIPHFTEEVDDILPLIKGNFNQLKDSDFYAKYSKYRVPVDGLSLNSLNLKASESLKNIEEWKQYRSTLVVIVSRMSNSEEIFVRSSGVVITESEIKHWFVLANRALLYNVLKYIKYKDQVKCLKGKN